MSRFAKDMDNDKNSPMLKKKTWFLAGGMILLTAVLMVICSFVLSFRQSFVFSLDEIPQFTVTSTNLHDGKWDTVITNTEFGRNLSPQLSWKAVDGAAVYVIYMIDPDGRNWIHMKAENLTAVSLDEGELESGYVGPYPPQGTHSYEIYVFALKSRKDSYPGELDHVSDGIDALAALLHVYENGDWGNILAYGMISGTYSHGDR